MAGFNSQLALSTATVSVVENTNLPITQTVPVGNLRAGSDITPSTTQFDCDSPGFFQEIHEREQMANLGLLLTISSSLTL